MECLAEAKAPPRYQNEAPGVVRTSGALCSNLDELMRAGHYGLSSRVPSRSRMFFSSSGGMSAFALDR